MTMPHPVRQLPFKAVAIFKSRGLRKKTGTDDQLPALVDSDISRKAFRKNWARLIQKIYNVDPLLCPKCSGSMKIISFIDDSEIIKKILNHLGLWDVKRKPPPRANGPPIEASSICDDPSAPGVDDYLIDPDYPIETYLKKKSSFSLSGELRSKLPKSAPAPQKINVDNQVHFRYSDDYCLRLIDFNILCCS